MSADQATVARLLIDVHNMQAGRVLPHEGTDPGTGWELVTVDDEVLALDPEHCEVLPVAPVDDGSFHILVETGHHAGRFDPEPDLADIFRLIRYLREHGISVYAGTASRRMGADPEPDHPMRVQFYAGQTYSPEGTLLTQGNRWSIVEGRALAQAFYVGPDGTVYDEHGIAL